VTEPPERTEPLTPPAEVVPDEVLDELRGAFEPESVASTPEPLAAQSSRLIVIGGDDLPDAVYLDEEAEQRLRDTHRTDDDSGGTILIGDVDLEPLEAGTSAATSSPGTAALTMDPRVRARRIGVARAKGRRRLFWVAVGVGVSVLLVAAFGVAASSLFSVRTVDVQGAVYTDPDRLAEIVDALAGEPMLLVDTAAAVEQLEQIPWVEQAEVRKDFPDTLVVDIRERVPVITFVGSDGRWRVTDRDGRVLDVLDGQPLAPMLVAGVGPDAEPGQFAGSGFDDVAVLVVALPPELRTITRAATVNPTTGDLGLLFDDDVTVNLGQPADLPAKLARLLQRVREGLDGVASIDVSTGEVSTTPG
jgi:cell division protein FtsQ